MQIMLFLTELHFIFYVYLFHGNVNYVYLLLIKLLQFLYKLMQNGQRLSPRTLATARLAALHATSRKQKTVNTPRFSSLSNWHLELVMNKK